MKESSRVWAVELEAGESITSGDDAYALPSMGSNSRVSKPLANSTTHSSIVKPLLNGCLTGQIHALVRHYHNSMDFQIAQILYNKDPYFKKRLSDLKIRYKPILRKDLLFGLTHTTASLGIFEILTKKLRYTNDGMPLTLYQEACCGLTAGATAALVWQPCKISCYRVGPQNITYRNWFSTLCNIVRNEGILTLWRGSGWYMGSRAVGSMGMLTSYNRSLNYLGESEGPPKWMAQISAGIISGFFGAAFSYPCIYLRVIQEEAQRLYHGGHKHAYRNIPLCISRILTPYSGFRFYSGFLNSFQKTAVFCLVQWWIFEDVRAAKEPMQGHSTPHPKPSSHLEKDQISYQQDNI